MRTVTVELSDLVGHTFRSWPAAYSRAHSAAQLSGYRYQVRADRARPGLWLVSRKAQLVRVKR